MDAATDGAGGAAGLLTGLAAPLETTGTVIAGFTCAPAAIEFPLPEPEFPTDVVGCSGVEAAAFGEAAGVGLVGAVDFLGSSAGLFTAAAGGVDAPLRGVALAEAAAGVAGFLPPGAGELGARSGAGELLADAAGKGSLLVPFLSADLDTFTALEVAIFWDGSAGGADDFSLATGTFATAGAITGAGVTNFLAGRAVDFARLVAGADSFALEATGPFGVAAGVTAADCFPTLTEGTAFSGIGAFCVARGEEGGGVGEVPSGATLRGAARRAGFIRFANYG